nr:DNA internalization-related competence protein ComEC/Rec2 [Paenibacillus turicensis]
MWMGISLMLPLLGYVVKNNWKQHILYWIIFTSAILYWNYYEQNNVSLIEESNKHIQAGTKLNLQGVILEPPEIDGDRVRFTLAAHEIEFMPKISSINKEKLAVQLTLATKDEINIAKSWKRGDIISFSGTLEQPNTATNFEGFNYRLYLQKQGIHWIVKVEGASVVTLLEKESFSPLAFLAHVDLFRQHIGSIIDELFPDWQGGYMKGLLIGITDDLSDDKYKQFTNLGMTHILAISGTHVAINIGLVFGLLRLLKVTRERAYSTVFWLLPIYVFMTGFSPSVLRAGLMTMLGIFLLKRGLFKDGLNTLSVVAFVMLIWQPYYLFNISFQLSFAVTAGIIVFTPFIKPYLLWLPAKIRDGIAITIAAELISFPLTLYYFNQYSLLSMLANLALVPIISAITLPVGTISLLLGSIWLPLGKSLAFIVQWLNLATFSITKWLNEMSGFMTYWKSPSMLWILIYYVMLYLMFYLQHRPKLELSTNTHSLHDTVPLENANINRGRDSLQYVFKAGYYIFFIAWFMIMLVIAYQPLNEKGIGYVQFIDVGQGDCILITTPSGINILVDGGGTVSFRKPKDAWRSRKVPYEVGEKTVVPLLKKRGIHKLDIVIMTHADQDHIGGLQAVLTHFPVRALVKNGSIAQSKTLTKLLETALAKDIPIYSAYRGMGLALDPLTSIDFVYPEAKPDGSIPIIKDQNHESIVFYLTMDGVRFLFTGDMDIAAEDAIMNLEKSPKRLQAEVLKIAHHGSKTSTSLDWLKAIKPKLTVIPVGSRNSYGHPHPNVLQHIDEQGIPIYRTDQNGEVQMKVDGGQLSFRTYSHKYDK